MSSQHRRARNIVCILAAKLVNSLLRLHYLRGSHTQPAFPAWVPQDHPSNPAVDTAYRPCCNLWDGLRIQRHLAAMLGIPFLCWTACHISLLEAMSFLPNTRWVYT